MAKLSPKSVRAIIIHEGKILLMHRIEKNEDYYCFPGGSIELGENPETALLREIKEETSLVVSVGELLYCHRFHSNDNDQLFYLCKYVSGKPHLRPESEEFKELSDDHFEEPVWVEIKMLPGLRVLPLEVRDSFLEDRKSEFKDAPKNVMPKQSSF